ncbi:MAG: ferritin-like domain-containing protein [Campylobacterota bacterium]|nr:ferritin-like domain-containing protein [Campylobacterota bacterium]
MNFFKTLENILEIANSAEKIETFNTFYRAYQENEVVFESDFKAKEFNRPSYASICSIVAPQVVPKRKNITTDEGKITLLHAVAHIEYSAIDLALDAAYRFSNLPKAYYDDWLKVADDEVRHFGMLEALLIELGSYYGAIEVHNALFEASQRTAHSFLERMAVVPRYLEANGLDATPLILKKLKRLPQDKVLNSIIEALHVIVDEEIEHVQKGDRWFAYACEKEGVTKDIYFEIIEKYYPRTFEKKRVLNTQGRLEAGFTCKELETIASQKVC